MLESEVAFRNGRSATVAIRGFAEKALQSGKTLTLNCNGDKTAFTIDDDGALNGPPNGFLSRLTKKK